MSNSVTVRLGHENYMSNYSQFPISIKSGKGMILTDEDGKEYLDFVAGIAVNALGYGDEDERKALLSVIEEGVLHTSNLYSETSTAWTRYLFSLCPVTPVESVIILSSTVTSTESSRNASICLCERTSDR